MVNMGIFRQIVSFSKVLVGWSTGVQKLVVRGAIPRMTGSLRGKVVFFP
jgi:hypothetical protein